MLETGLLRQAFFALKGATFSSVYSGKACSLWCRMTSTSSPAETPDHSNPHYLRAVSGMAQRSCVVAQSAIYNDNGIKLIEKGGRISSQLYDRLVEHRLREPIENQLAVENAVNTQALLGSARELAESDPLAVLLVKALGSIAPLLEPLRSLPLPAPVAFKLTVMREERPMLFKHSMLMALVSLFLGIREGLDARLRVSLAAAALLHDVGMLHMDPVWFDNEKKITGADRRHLVVHPVTAMLMVRDAKVYTRAVELAVLEHHERMDGTGYPRGLQGVQISQLGRILLLAEVVSAFYEKFTEHPARQLSLMLRLHHQKFPAELVVHLLSLLQSVQVSATELPENFGSNAERRMDMLTQAVERWESTLLSAPVHLRTTATGGDQNALAFLDKRVRTLEKTLAEAGMHPLQLTRSYLEQFQQDADGMAELEFVGREALWQLRSIANACLRRWPLLPAQGDPTPETVTDAAVVQWCSWVLQQE